jgi:hypothetical protein
MRLIAFGKQFVIHIEVLALKCRAIPLSFGSITTGFLTGLSRACARRLRPGIG